MWTRRRTGPDEETHLVRVSARSPADTTLRGRQLVAARAVSLVLIGLALSLSAAGFLVVFQRPDLVAAQPVSSALAQAGWSNDALVDAVALLVPMMVCAATGLLIFWRRSDDWMAMFFAVSLITFGAFASRSLYAHKRTNRHCRRSCTKGGHVMPLSIAQIAEANKAVVRRYYEEFWNKGDVAVVEECFAPEVLLDGQYVAWTLWRNGLTAWSRAFPDIQHHVDHLIAERDLVAANIRFTGTHRGVFHQGKWGPWAPTGKAIAIREMNFFRLAAGKIVEFWTAWDATAFAQQLGETNRRRPPRPDTA
jgi:predicted ester cyclase